MLGSRTPRSLSPGFLRSVAIRDSLDEMKARSWLPTLILLLLATATAAGWLWTRETAPPSALAAEAKAPANKGFRHGAPVRQRLVDQTPLLTARSLVPSAQTVEEKDLARQAERLANHEVDLAFTDALLRAASAPVPDTPEIRELSNQKAAAQAALEADRQAIARLTREQAKAQGARRDALDDQLEVAKAQLELDKDELEAAAEELGQAGGDPQARIRRLKEAHEAADRESSEAMVPERQSSFFRPGSLVARLGDLTGQVRKYRRLVQARQEALDKVQTLTKRRETIAESARKEAEDREAAKYWASNLVKDSATDEGGPGREQTKAAVSYLRQYGDSQRRLSDMGRRIQDQQGLAETYGNWMGLVDGYRTAALHGLLDRVLWILGLIFAAYASGLLLNGLRRRPKAGERNEASTPRAVLKVILKVICVLAIGFVIFGMPAQPTTVFGLAGAGLTVALKDFIVAFFGWFILMGRNGIRVGDWVEIRGVGGEVVEIGLLRTVVLETGNWTDSEHPTGRRVAFVNNFAIEGHFFNFSTSGRWMWDELRVLIPHGQDPYPIMDGVQKLVVEQTEANARLAEQDWKKATARYRVETFTTTPGLFVLPTLHGIEIKARYITRATERDVTRLRLNRAMVELMHGPRAEAGASVPPDEAR